MYLNIHMKRKQVLLKYFPVTEDDWKSRIFQDHTDFPNKLYVCMYVSKRLSFQICIIHIVKVVIMMKNNNNNIVCTWEHMHQIHLNTHPFVP